MTYNGQAIKYSFLDCSPRVGIPFSAALTTGWLPQLCLKTPCEGRILLCKASSSHEIQASIYGHLRASCGRSRARGSSLLEEVLPHTDLTAASYNLTCESKFCFLEQQRTNLHPHHPSANPTEWENPLNSCHVPSLVMSGLSLWVRAERR